RAEDSWCLCLSRGHGDARRPARDRRRPRADRCGTRVRFHRGHCSRLRRRAPDSVRWHAVPARHRPARPAVTPGAITRSPITTSPNQDITQLNYSVTTFGCRVNQADSLGFEEDLLAHGAVAAAPEEADVVVVNTCSVTATADQGARQTIRRVARENPAARIVVTGCYATRRPEEIAALPNVEHVVCNDDKPKLIPLIAGPTPGSAPAIFLP